MRRRSCRTHYRTVTRELNEEWTRLAWHEGGLSWPDYLGLSLLDTWEKHRALTEQIRRVEDDGPTLPTRPREWRR